MALRQSCIQHEIDHLAGTLFTACRYGLWTNDFKENTKNLRKF